jgi:nitrogen regulatory protein P-II 1
VKKIEAVIPPSRLEEAKRALAGPWIAGMSVTEVKAYGGEARAGLFRGVGLTADASPEVRLEVVVPDPLVARVLHDLERCLRGGPVGLGRIVVDPVDEAVRVRTGERGEGAL